MRPKKKILLLKDAFALPALDNAQQYCYTIAALIYRFNVASQGVLLQYVTVDVL